MSGLAIGVDVGSTSVKAVAVDRESRELIAVESALLDSQVPGLPGGHHEEGPLRIRDLTWSLMRRLGERYGDRVEAIGFTGQMHSGMIVNEHLEPMTNLVTWQDLRGNEPGPDGLTYVETLRHKIGPDRTGVGIHSGFLAVTADWWRHHGVHIPTDGYLIGIYDWLTSLHVGRPVTDITSAAAWGLFDILEKRWRPEALDVLELSPDTLPEVLEPATLIGRLQPNTAKELSLRASTEIYSSMGDTQASYVGAGTRPDEILLNFGTGSQSMWETSDPRMSDHPATPGTDIRYLASGRYIATAPTLAGGKAYQILATFYRSVLEAYGVHVADERDLYQIMNAAAEKSPSRRASLAFDPIFGGSRWREPDTRASIVGLTSENFTFDSVTRALLAGMVDEIAAPYFAAGAARSSALANHSGLRGAGNGMRRNAALRSIAEERFGLPLVLSNSEEEAACGAAPA